VASLHFGSCRGDARRGRVGMAAGVGAAMAAYPIWLTRWARGAYAAYLLQAPVLIGSEIAERSLPWPAVIKAVTVAALAVAGSFILGRLLV
jgi:hypothetical protein